MVLSGRIQADTNLDTTDNPTQSTIATIDGVHGLVDGKKDGYSSEEAYLLLFNSRRRSGLSSPAYISPVWTTWVMINGARGAKHDIDFELATDQTT